MSEADRMLKEMGFKREDCYGGKDEIVYFNSRTGIEFLLNKEYKSFTTHYGSHISSENIEAIYEKMKELGWIK